MKLRKLCALLMTLMLIFIFAGCSAKQETANEEPVQEEVAESALSGEITFSTWGSLEEKKVNEEIIALFEAENPGTKVNLEYIPKEYTQKIDTMFMGNNAPDVIYGHPKYFAKWASQDLLMDLTGHFEATPDLMDDEKFNTNLYEAFKYKGKHIATINGADTILLFYNKKLFDEAGVAYPNDEWTWYDFIDAAKKLTIVEDGKPVQYGTALNDWYVTQEVFGLSNGAEWYDDMNKPTKVKFNSEANVAALQLMQDLIHKYKVAPTNSDREILGGSFDNGKIAMDFNGVWTVVFRKDIKDFEWGIANIPLTAGEERKIPALYAGYAISKNTENPDLAWEFAKYMQSDEAQKLLASSGLITVINKNIASSDDVLKIEGAPDHHELRVSSLQCAVHNDAMVTNWDETIAKHVAPNMQLLLSNDQDAETTAQKIQEGLEQMLEEAESTQ